MPNGKEITSVVVHDEMRTLAAYYKVVDCKLISRFVELDSNEAKRLKRFYKQNGRVELSEWYNEIGKCLRTD